MYPDFLLDGVWCPAAKHVHLHGGLDITNVHLDPPALLV
jgi:hypothetical protein